MNNILKSFFISLLPLVALYFTIDGVLHIVEQGLSSSPRYIGRIVTGITIVLFFGLLFIRPVARTDANLKIYTIFIAIGLFISLWYGGYKEQDLNGSLPSIGLFLGWILYLRWYSVFTNRNTNHILRLGEKFPKLEFLDTDQNMISTDQFLGSPSIFLFYRGNWCPLCMAQIKEIASQYKELEKRNVNTLLISPQPHKHSKALARKYNLNFHFLVDKKNKAAEKLEILAKNGLPMGFQVLGYDSDTVQPTVIITDANGIIVFADLTDNYRVRPEPDTFIKIIDTIPGI